MNHVIMPCEKGYYIRDLNNQGDKREYKYKKKKNNTVGTQKDRHTKGRNVRLSEKKNTDNETYLNKATQNKG